MELIQVRGVYRLRGRIARIFSTPTTPHSSSKSPLGLSTFWSPRITGSKLKQLICTVSSQSTTPVTAKPKLGRPKKKRPDAENEHISEPTSTTSIATKPKRGRPRKKSPATQNEEKLPKSQTSVEHPEKDFAQKRDRAVKKVQEFPDFSQNGNEAQNLTVNADASKDIPEKKDEGDYNYDENDEDEDETWPVDEDNEERWRVKASDYFKESRIRNVVGKDGSVIDWEGESHKGLVHEISCMEWEIIAFHPAPLIVLVFERYNRASVNWKVVKELERAIQVYYNYNKLPPRTVKIDAKIEKDLASALRAKEIPQLLFIRRGKLLYRETEVRTADELVKMIAHFYYKAKRPPFIEAEALFRGEA